MTPCLNASILEQHHPSVMTSHIVLQPRIVTQYTLHPEVCQHCHNRDIRANWETVPRSCWQLSTRKCCKLQDTWIDNAAKREESIYKLSGENKLLIPPVCCLRQNSCLVLCAPLPVSKLPISCRHPPHLQVTPPTCSHTVTDRDNPRILQTYLKTKLMRRWRQSLKF